MQLDNNLIKQFVAITNDSVSTSKETKTCYGTVVVKDSSTYVKIDGSDILTPVAVEIDAKDGDRVVVTIENHKASISSNISSPASGRGATDLYTEETNEDGTTSSSGILNRAKVYIDELVAEEITAEDISANSGYIKELTSEKITAGRIKSSIIYTSELEANDINVKNILADRAKIEELETSKLDAETADVKYAQIDFANIGKAAMEYFYSKSGLIKNVTVGDQTITGELVGVTIKGDIIEGGTVKADKLVIKGEDGLFYKLNVDALGETTASSDEKYQNGLDGSAIIAKSITAEQISVKDLVAFGATIGGFKIGDDSIYSGVKSSVANTTRGIYLDDDGQFSFGDGDNFIRFYKSTSGEYKLQISTNDLKIGSNGTDIADAIDDIKNEMDTIKDEVTTNLRIDSSRGTVFKNNAVSTVLSAVIYRGSQRITDITALKEAMGSSAYLQWSWQRIDETSFGIISATDSRISNDGFTFTLSPDDVDTKVTFMCELIT